MFYRLFDYSEFNPLFMFIDNAFGVKKSYKALTETRNEFLSYKETFNNCLYKYKPQLSGEKKEDYCLGDDINLPNVKRRISTVIKKYDTIKSKDDFIKVKNEYFSFNSIDTSILAINYDDYGKKDYISNFLKNIFQYFGLNYKLLNKYKKESYTSEIKIKQKWIGAIAYFAYKGKTCKLLAKYPLLENEALLFIIDFIIDNYSQDFIEAQVDMLDDQIDELITFSQNLICEFSKKENAINIEMKNSSDDLEKYCIYNSFLQQLQVYKKILNNVLKIANDNDFYNQTDLLKGFLSEGYDDMDTMTKIFMNQVIAVNFLTKLYGRIFNADIFFENSFFKITE